MNLRDYPDVLTVYDIVQILQIGKNTAYELIKSGKIKSHKIGRIYRIPKTCLQDFLQSARYAY